MKTSRFCISQLSNASSTAGIHPTRKESFDSTTETMQETPSAFQLKDYGDFTLDADFKVIRVSRQATQNEEAGNDMDSTTIESSTMAMKLEQESSENNVVELSTQSGAKPHPETFEHSSYFPYPPSGNPSAQHVSITHPPYDKPYLASRSFYDFFPSQPDYNQQISNGFFPYYCINSVYHKFIPIVPNTIPSFSHKRR